MAQTLQLVNGIPRLVDIPTGSGGAKNYLGTVNDVNLNGDFELGNTTGWSLGTIGTLTGGIPTGTPTFGSGASGNLSISAVSSGQLAGSYSLSYLSSAATTAGNMLSSDAFTIDIADQAKVLRYEFSYKAQTNPNNANWSGSSSSSFGIAAWDVTNSVWLGVPGRFGMIQSSGVGVAEGTFQTNSNTSQIRFIVYNANATTGAVTVYFDDFALGPQSTSTGLIPKPSTIQKFTSGSGTYTRPDNVYQIKVRMVGGGGGGGGAGVANNGGTGGTGGNTTFGTSLLIAYGGVGAAGYYQGDGGTGSLGTGPIGTSLTGGTGGAGHYGQSINYIKGGVGGSSYFGGAGQTGPQAGLAAKANTGSGGGGGSMASATNGYGGGGGGAGGYVEALISGAYLTPTFAYSVGSGGAGGSAGTTGDAAGAGASGYIEITEYFLGENVQMSDTVVWEDDVGQVAPFAISSANPPSGYLPADGTAVSRAAYYQLFAKLGTTFGVGDGSTTFNLPDLRGIFVRGAGTQTVSGQSYSGTLGTKQGDQMQGHYHNVQMWDSTLSGGNNSKPPSGGQNAIGSQATSSPITDGTNGTPRTGTQTHPANIALTYFIKYARTPAPVIAESVNLSALYKGTPTGTCSAAWNIITYPTKKKDTRNRYSSGSYLVDESGTFSIAAMVTINGTYTTLNGIGVAIYIDGVEEYVDFNYAGGSIGGMTARVSVFSIPLLAGQVVTIRAYSSATSPAYVGATQNQFSIVRTGNY